MIRYGFMLALVAGCADLGRAEVQPLLATGPIVLAAVDNAPKPETSPGLPGVMDPFGDTKAPPGMTPELRPVAPANRRMRERVPTGNPLWAVPLSLLSVTRDRPIFSPTRRPPPPVVAGVPYVEPPPPPPSAPGPIHPQLSLVGTVANDKEGIGVFIDQATNNIVRLRTGEGHAGWILRAVRVREVTLQNSGLTEILSLPPPGLQAGVPQLGIPQPGIPLPGVPQPGVPQRGVPQPSVHQPGAPWTSVPPNGEPDNL
jgi:general secretion pathway protein N